MQSFNQPAASPTQAWEPTQFPSDSDVSTNMGPAVGGGGGHYYDSGNAHCYTNYQRQQEPTPIFDQQQRQFNTPPPQQQQGNLCYGCGMKSVVMGSTFCSRRCQWIVAAQCPQCGKPKQDTHFVYCSRSCSHQSSQANWCGHCGVCQTTISGACSNQHCNGAVNAATGSMPSSGPMKLGLGGGSKANKSHGRMECRMMNSSEVSSSGLPSVFSSMFSSGLGVRIVAAIKLTASAAHRKRYLSHRSIVENQMASRGVVKYGHGGEGNEQRRFFGVPLRCGLGYAQGTATPAGMHSASGAVPVAPIAIGDSAAAKANHNRQQQQQFNMMPGSAGVTSLRTCHDPSCVACTILTRGFDMNAMGLGSHYCNTTSTAAAQYLEPSPRTHLKAIVVSRVVVGNPELHVVDATSELPFIQPPADPAEHHSMVITNNEPNYDGTYVFSDDAVDPQYLVLFE